MGRIRTVAAAAAGLGAAMATMTGIAQADEPERRDPSAGVHELQEVLRAEHPDTFAGLWLEGEDIVIAVVAGEEALLATAEETLPGPGRLRTVPAENTEAELERAMDELNAVFGELSQEQSVHTLGVRLPRNRVVLEAEQPEDVDLSPYVTADVAEMVAVEGGEQPTILEAEDAAGDAGGDTAAILIVSAVLLVALVGGLWYARRRRSVA